MLSEMNHQFGDTPTPGGKPSDWGLIGKAFTAAAIILSVLAIGFAAIVVEVVSSFEVAEGAYDESEHQSAREAIRLYQDRMVTLQASTQELDSLIANHQAAWTSQSGLAARQAPKAPGASSVSSRTTKSPDAMSALEANEILNANNEATDKPFWHRRVEASKHQLQSEDQLYAVLAQNNIRDWGQVLQNSSSSFGKRLDQAAQTRLSRYIVRGCKIGQVEPAVAAVMLKRYPDQQSQAEYLRWLFEQEDPMCFRPRGVETNSLLAALMACALRLPPVEICPAITRIMFWFDQDDSEKEAIGRVFGGTVRQLPDDVPKDSLAELVSHSAPFVSPALTITLKDSLSFASLARAAVDAVEGPHVNRHVHAMRWLAHVNVNLSEANLSKEDRARVLSATIPYWLLTDKGYPNALQVYQRWLGDAPPPHAEAIQEAMSQPIVHEQILRRLIELAIASPEGLNAFLPTASENILQAVFSRFLDGDAGVIAAAELSLLSGPSRLPGEAETESQSKSQTLDPWSFWMTRITDKGRDEHVEHIEAAILEIKKDEAAEQITLQSIGRLNQMRRRLSQE